MQLDLFGEEVLGDVERTSPELSQAQVVEGFGEHLEGALLAAGRCTRGRQRAQRVVVAEREGDPAGPRQVTGNAADLGVALARRRARHEAAEPRSCSPPRSVRRWRRARDRQRSAPSPPEARTTARPARPRRPTPHSSRRSRIAIWIASNTASRARWTSSGSNARAASSIIEAISPTCPCVSAPGRLRERVDERDRGLELPGSGQEQRVVEVRQRMCEVGLGADRVAGGQVGGRRAEAVDSRAGPCPASAPRRVRAAPLTRRGSPGFPRDVRHARARRRPRHREIGRPRHGATPSGQDRAPRRSRPPTPRGLDTDRRDWRLGRRPSE